MCVCGIETGHCRACEYCCTLLLIFNLLVSWILWSRTSSKRELEYSLEIYHGQYIANYQYSLPWLQPLLLQYGYKWKSIYIQQTLMWFCNLLLMRIEESVRCAIRIAGWIMSWADEGWFRVRSTTFSTSTRNSRLKCAYKI